MADTKSTPSTTKKYEAMTVSELKGLLSQRNIPGRSYLHRKDQMVHKLYQYDTGAKISPNNSKTPSGSTVSKTIPFRERYESIKIDPNYYLTIPETKELDKYSVAVLRTYLYGLGLEVGIAVAKPELIRLIDLVRYADLAMPKEIALADYFRSWGNEIALNEDAQKLLETLINEAIYQLYTLIGGDYSPIAIFNHPPQGPVDPQRTRRLALLSKYIERRVGFVDPERTRTIDNIMETLINQAYVLRSDKYFVQNFDLLLALADIAALREFYYDYLHVKLLAQIPPLAEPYLGKDPNTILKQYLIR